MGSEQRQALGERTAALLVVALSERAQTVGRERSRAQQRIDVTRVRERAGDLVARLLKLSRAVPIPRAVPVPEQRIGEAQRLLGA